MKEIGIKKNERKNMTRKSRKDIKTRAFEKESIRLAEIAKEREWNSFLEGGNEWKILEN